MDKNNTVPKKRGPYKKYLTNPDIPIPRSTKTRHSNKDENVEAESSSDDSDYLTFEREIATKERQSKKRKRSKSTVQKPSKSKPNDSESELEYSQHQGFADNVPDDIDTDDLQEVQCTDSAYSSESENNMDLISDENDSDDSYGMEDENATDLYNESQLSDEEQTDICEDTEQAQAELYEGSRISKTQSNLITMAYSLRHNLPDVGLENFISVIDCHLLEDKLQSKYHLMKSQPVPETTEYYYCSECSEILSFNEQQNATCRLCGTVFKKIDLKKSGQFFVSLSLKQQLQEIMNSDLQKEFRNSCAESDVINGCVYKKLKKDHVIGDNDITLQINVDGVSLSKSSKASLWPILVTINELPYRTRKNNVLICGLWFGDKKPDINMYLKPLVQELISLCSEGIQIASSDLQEKSITIKVHTILCTVDSVARAMVQNWKQFNGSYGCPYCMHKGERISVGRGFSRVYCYLQTKERTNADYEKHLKLAVASGKVIRGVKGPSILSSIPNMHVIHSCPPEYLHNSLLGVTKLFVKAWFDPKYKNEPFYLGKHLQEFNSRLLQVKPPSEVTRTPRPITDTYKANEWKNLLLYASTVCLYGIMEPRYLSHWGLFVFALSILLQEQISKDDLRQAKDALHSFVRQIETLYKKEFYRFNVHLLLHLHKFVALYGGLWAWSTFPFEGFNGVIRHLYFGTQYIPLQICKLYCRLRYIRNNTYIFNGDDVNPKVLNLFLKLMNQCKVSNCIEYGNDLRTFGKPKQIELSVLERHVVERQLADKVHDVCKGFDRFIYKHVLFHSTNYGKIRKRDNSVIQTKEGIIMKISRLLIVNCPDTQEMKYVVIGSQLKILNETLYTGRSPSIESKGYCFITQETTNIVCCKIESIKTKCINIAHPMSDKRCIFLLVNKIETD